MLLAEEIRGELARIQPARACCRRAELVGLLHDRPDGLVRTLDLATARTAVALAASTGIEVAQPSKVPADRRRPPGRHHLLVRIDRGGIASWSWDEAPLCDRRSFLRGVLLGSGSISLSASGPHVEVVHRSFEAAEALREALASLDVRSFVIQRRGRWVVYLKGQEEIVSLLRLVGANRGVLELETHRVGRDVQARLNRLLNAEEANLGRTVEAADRQLAAIASLDASGRLASLGRGLQDAAAIRRRMPDADLDTLAAALGISRSAANHRMRRLVELAADEES